LREVLPKVNFELDEIPYELISKLEVKQAHFTEAMRGQGRPCRTSCQNTSIILPVLPINL
jgi:hypothetical protein